MVPARAAKGIFAKRGEQRTTAAARMEEKAKPDA